MLDSHTKEFNGPVYFLGTVMWFYERPAQQFTENGPLNSGHFREFCGCHNLCPVLFYRALLVRSV
jgi:hypothetical protein